MTKQNDLNEKANQDIWDKLKSKGYLRGIGENIVGQDKLLLAKLTSDGIAQIDFYQDERVLRQLELKNCLLNLGIKSSISNREYSQAAIQRTYNQLEKALIELKRY